MSDVKHKQSERVSENLKEELTLIKETLESVYDLCRNNSDDRICSPLSFLNYRMMENLRIRYEHFELFNDTKDYLNQTGTQDKLSVDGEFFKIIIIHYKLDAESKQDEKLIKSSLEEGIDVIKRHFSVLNKVAYDDLRFQVDLNEFVTVRHKF